MKKLFWIILLQINLYSVDFFISYEDAENSLTIYNENDSLNNNTPIPLAEMREDSSNIPLSIGFRSDKHYYVGEEWGIGYFVESSLSFFNINKQSIDIDEINSITINYDTSVSGLNAYFTPTLFLSMPFPFIIPLGPGAAIPLGHTLIIGFGIGYAYTYTKGEYKITRSDNLSYNEIKQIDENNTGINMILMFELPMLSTAKDTIISIGGKLSVSDAGNDEEGIYRYTHTYKSIYLKYFF